MPYSNVPLSNLKHKTDDTMPSVDVAANPVIQADVAQLRTALIDLGIAKAVGGDDIHVIGPYSNIQVGDFKKHTSKIYLPAISTDARPLKAEVDAVVTAMKNLGLAKATGAQEPVRHGPYTNVSLRYLKKKSDFTTPAIAAPSSPPTGPELDEIVAALKDLGLIGLQYAVTTTAGGLGAGAILPAAGTDLVNDDAETVYTITPEADNIVSVFTVGGVDKLAELIDLGDGSFKYTFPAPTTAVTVAVEFEAAP